MRRGKSDGGKRIKLQRAPHLVAGLAEARQRQQAPVRVPDVRLGTIALAFDGKSKFTLCAVPIQFVHRPDCANAACASAFDSSSWRALMAASRAFGMTMAGSPYP
jgi:hypothetical protein